MSWIIASTFLLTLGVIVFIAYQATNRIQKLDDRLDNIDEKVEEDIETEKIESAVMKSWKQLELSNEIGRVEKQAEQIQELHTDITQMMKNPRERGEFGEVKLDTLLSNHLPEDMYGIRQQVIDGKTPDAYIESSTGKICIDSKFPMDNYKKLLEAETEEEKQEYQTKFKKDVEKQLKQIEKKYIKPEKGTTDFAFEFIPSENVYYYLVKEEYSLLQKYTKKGVQVVSPLTLGHKLELVKSDVHAKKLSQKTENVLQVLQNMETKFEQFDEDWNTLRRHLRNAKNKSDEVDTKYNNLKSQFKNLNDLE